MGTEVRLNLGRRDIGIDHTNTLLSVAGYPGVLSRTQGEGGYQLNPGIAFSDPVMAGNLALWYQRVATQIYHRSGDAIGRIAFMVPNQTDEISGKGLAIIAKRVASGLDVPELVMGVEPSSATSVAEEEIRGTRILLASWQVNSGGHVGKVSQRLRDQGAIVEHLIAFAVTEGGVRQVSSKEINLRAHFFLALPHDIERSGFQKAI